VTAIGGGTTFTAAEAVEPFRLAVTPACPYASAVTGTLTLVCPAATTTCGGTVTMPAGVADSGTIVSVDCADEIVSASVVLAPGVTVATTGSSDTTDGAAGVTVTWLAALEPLRLAVTRAAPAESPFTGIDAVTCPAATVTLDGADATPALLLVTAICVGACCADEIVTSSVPLPPWVMLSVAGVTRVIVGGAGVTFTVLVDEPPFALAVIVVLPGATPVTGTTTDVWPGA
jgi:hypothetical protein